MARVIVKIGTSSLTGELGQVDEAMVAELCQQVADVRGQGHQVVVVSSGAVSAGVAALGLQQRPADLPTLQALAALRPAADDGDVDDARWPTTTRSPRRC